MWLDPIIDICDKSTFMFNFATMKNINSKFVLLQLKH
jgi:hypothetical protein